jgi:uncharacterized membrane protein
VTRLWQFVKTTLIGGFLFLAPLIITLYVASKGIAIVEKGLAPLERLLPVHTMYGIAVYDIVAALVLVAIAFCAGVIARTGAGQRLAQHGEGLILRWVPGYTLFKSMSQESTAKAGGVKVVLLNIDGGWAFAFLMEQHAHGMVTVFLPNAPNPAAGNVYFMNESQIRHVDVSVARAVRCLQQLGIGSHALLAKVTWPT